MTPSPELSRLQQSVRESRITVSKEYSGLLSDLDMKKRFSESVRRPPVGWIAGAAAAGLLATLFGRGGKKVSKPASLPLADAAVRTTGVLSKAGWLGVALQVGKFLYPVLRPVVVDFVTNAAKAGLAKRGRPL